jgi:hypothetical protein
MDQVMCIATFGNSGDLVVIDGCFGCRISLAYAGDHQRQHQWRSLNQQLIRPHHHHPLWHLRSDILEVGIDGDEAWSCSVDPCL